MLVEVEVQPVSEGVHQGLEPRWAGIVLGLQDFGIDEQLHPKIKINLRLALSLGETAHGIDVVCFYAVEVVFCLSVLRPKNSIGVGFAVYVSDTPVVADDRDTGCL